MDSFDQDEKWSITATATESLNTQTILQKVQSASDE